MPRSNKDITPSTDKTITDTTLKNTDPHTPNHLLRVHDLAKHYPVRVGVRRRDAAWVKAVDGISFSIQEGETLGLVGEPGCGKSTVGNCILRLLQPTSGSIELRGSGDQSLGGMF